MGIGSTLLQTCRRLVAWVGAWAAFLALVQQPATAHVCLNGPVASGQTSSTVHYGPFGRILAQAGEFQGRYLFSSKEWEAEAGLSYYGYRFYNPGLGRWTSRDPLQERGSINLYGFVANNLNTIDPMGLAEAFVNNRLMLNGLQISVPEGEYLSSQSNVEALWVPLENTARALTYGIGNVLGGGQDILDLVGLTEETQEGLIFSAAQTLGPSPAFYADDLGAYALNMPARIRGNIYAWRFRKCPAAKSGPGVAWPINRGFVAGEGAPASVLPGQVLDRYGGTGGSFLSPAGTPAAARSLAPGVELRPLNSYQVIKPFEASAGRVAPAFGQPGLGLQFDLGQTTVQDLINSGHILPTP